MDQPKKSIASVMTLIDAYSATGGKNADIRQQLAEAIVMRDRANEDVIETLRAQITALKSQAKGGAGEAAP